MTQLISRQRRTRAIHRHTAIGCPASLWLLGPMVCLAALVGTATAEVVLERKGDRVSVSIDGDPFTNYIFAGRATPILFPIHGPGGQTLTRQWPLVEGVAGDPHDHPHQESVWFAHGQINGIDFWAHIPSEKGGAHPRIEQTGIQVCSSGTLGVLETTNRWVAADGTTVCTDSRRIEFASDGLSTQSGAARTIDYAVTIRADHGPLVFGDTKEGVMALRVRPEFQTRNLHQSQGAAGQILNSEAQKDDAAWGKAARWVDYFAPIEGSMMGIAMCDHPDNLRHPQHFHARDYGLLAANPFGLHDFTGAPKGTGDFTLPAGDSLSLRYLMVFHKGDTATAGIEKRWQQWAQKKP